MGDSITSGKLWPVYDCHWQTLPIMIGRVCIHFFKIFLKDQANLISTYSCSRSDQFEYDFECTAAWNELL